MQYTIDPIPTEYNGRTYRSRPEARWACFFDLLGWTYEYEPFDLAGGFEFQGKKYDTRWTPDFILKGADDILVEIKPITLDIRSDIKKWTEIYAKAFDSFNIHDYKYVLCLGATVENALIGVLSVRASEKYIVYQKFNSHDAYIDALHVSNDSLLIRNYWKLPFVFDIVTTSFDINDSPTWDAKATKFLFTGQPFVGKDEEGLFETKTEKFHVAYNEAWQKAGDKVMFLKPKLKR